MKIVINGCFDCLHTGHINLLLFGRTIAGTGGRLIVAIDEDEKVMADKGLDRPIFNHHERAKALLDLKFADHPIVDGVEFFLTNKQLENFIRREKPDYLVKGSDWRGRKVVGSEFTKVLFYERMEIYSTTEIIKRCQSKIGK
jgi:cytidyltransferase-like protein